MKNITVNFLCTIFFSLFLSAFNSHAQGMRYEVSFLDQVEASSQIIEGKVIHQQSYWDANKHNIYTINTIEVFKVFKGDHITTIEVITNGGIVGLDAETVMPSLQFSPGDIGVFMLHDSPVVFADENVSMVPNYMVYSDSQGFYEYDIENNIATNGFQIKNGIIEILHEEIKNITQSDFTPMRPFIISTKRKTILKNRSSGGTVITSFTPTIATAGTQTQITIIGTDFGTDVGVVRFSNADDGGATFINGLATEIISWSDTAIVVKVNNKAGTGPIQVDANGFSTSSQTLTVPYAELNVNFDPGSGTEVYLTQHIDRDGSGGYIWKMQTDFDTSDAKDPFIRALDSWRCETEINWSIGAVTTTDVAANDNINIVRFDNGTELPIGVLGRCTSRWSGCGGATIKWYVEELDIVFNDDTNWNYSSDAPEFTEYDFESVAVHELGHGHQFGHVINSNAIMHYSISNSVQNRSLSSNDIDAGADVQSRSTGTAVCGQDLMINFDCATLSNIEVLLEDTLVLFPNPAQESIFLEGPSNINLNYATIYDITGKLVREVDLKKMNNLKTINIANLMSGMYFINIFSDQGILTKKFIVD